MRAIIKGKGTIYKTEYSQDTTGGRKETVIPITTERFVGRESRMFQTNFPGKQGALGEYKFWCETNLTINLSNLKESGYIQFESKTISQCYDIVGVTLVNSKKGKYGWELSCNKRV